MPADERRSASYTSRPTSCSTAALGHAYEEHDDLTPLTDYGRAKAEAEQVIASVDPTTPMVRTSLLYSDEADCHQRQLVRRAVCPGG